MLKARGKVKGLPAGFCYQDLLPILKQQVGDRFRVRCLPTAVVSGNCFREHIARGSVCRARPHGALRQSPERPGHPGRIRACSRLARYRVALRRAAVTADTRSALAGFSAAG